MELDTDSFVSNPVPSDTKTNGGSSRCPEVSHFPSLKGDSADAKYCHAHTSLSGWATAVVDSTMAAAAISFFMCCGPC